MKFKGIRPVVVILALVLGLSTIFGTQYVIKTYHLEEPFKDKVLSIDGIERVELTEASNGRKIQLTVGPEVELKEAYLQILSLANTMLKSRVTIELEGQKDQTLRGVYHEMHFAIYEGIASGRFTQMATELEQIAEENQIESYYLQVDEMNVYVKLVHQGEVLARIVPRQNSNIIAYAELGGGESRW